MFELNQFFSKIPNETSSEENIVKIVHEQLSDFQKGWESFVSSIDANTKQIAINSENLATINSNVQNTEEEILKISNKNQKLEKSAKDYFENVEMWTNEAQNAIVQLQETNEEEKFIKSKIFSSKFLLSFKKFFIKISFSHQKNRKK